jgi:hypothetical protein
MRRNMREHLHALDSHHVDVIYMNAAERIPRWVRLLDYDAVVLHYSFLAARREPSFEGYARRMAWLRRSTA